MEAAFWLAVIQVALYTIPFNRLAALIGLTRRTEPLDGGATQGAIADIERVRWAVKTAAAHGRWSAACLCQALSALVLLRRRGVHSTLFIGAVPDQSSAQGMRFHAWVRCGDEIVTGDGDLSSFTPVNIFESVSVR